MKKETYYHKPNFLPRKLAKTYSKVEFQNYSGEDPGPPLQGPQVSLSSLYPSLKIDLHVRIAAEICVLSQDIRERNGTDASLKSPALTGEGRVREQGSSEEGGERGEERSGRNIRV